MFTLPFTLAREGRYAIRLTAAQGPGFGTYDIELDGKKISTADFRAQEQAEADLLLGSHSLAKGDHTLAFRAASGREGPGPVTVEMLRFLRLPPEATRPVRTHNEAHFVRLGIGRAVYAYRLVYGAVPDSLEKLVKVGIMPQRYLKDENDIPLRSRREGDFLVVESTGPGRWTHRWQGLDARR
jgi:hypothetical protein